MSGRTHFAMAAAAAVWTSDAILRFAGPLVAREPVWLPGWLLAVILGGVAPDIDEPESGLGRRCWWLAWPLKRMVGHRTLSHSVLGIVLAGILAGAVVWWQSPPPHQATLALVIGLGLMVGMAVHVLGDLLSGSVPVWWPRPIRYSLARWPVFGWQDHLLGGLAGLVTLVGCWRMLAQLGPLLHALLRAPSNG